MRGKIGTTEVNLQAAFQNEITATEKAYPGMVEDAKEASSAVQKAFYQSMDTDVEHKELFENAMKDMLSGSRAELYVCQICGHINEGFVPKKCPVCWAVPGRFKKVD